MRYVTGLMSVGLLALVVGCGSQPAAGPASGTTTTTTTTITTTTTSAPPKLAPAEAQAKVDQAVVPAAAFASLGGQQTKAPAQYTKTKLLTVTCKGELISNASITAESGAHWAVAGAVVKASVVYYPGMSAKDEVVPNVRLLTKCGSYVEDWTEKKAKMTVTGEVTLPPAAEADGQFAWCEENEAKDFARCYVVYSRGSFVAAVQVANGGKDKAAASLTQVAPVAAKALANVG